MAERAQLSHINNNNREQLLCKAFPKKNSHQKLVAIEIILLPAFLCQRCWCGV